MSTVPAPPALRPRPSTRRPGAAIPPLLPVEGADVLVPLANGAEPVRYANLDYAASAPALTGVAERVREALPYYASVHRGAGWASQVSTAAYEAARRGVHSFLGGRADDVVIFTRNTTDSLNLLANAVPDDAGEVLLLDIEHHANLLPWRERPHQILVARASLEQTLADVENALANSQNRIALLAVTGASNVSGEELPLRRLGELAHAYGARFAVDAAQLAPHRRIDVETSGIDYLALSGHKIYAPYGAGVLIGRRDWLDAAPPYLCGGGAVRSVALDEVTWADAPARHEAGTPNVLGAVALAAACDVIRQLPAGALELHEEALRNRLVSGLEQIPGVVVHRIWWDSLSSIGVVTFTLAGFDPGLVAAVLSAEYGVGVRDGKFCAHPLLRRLGLPAGAVRASLGAGSSSDDVDRLLAALEHIARRGTQVRYRLLDGRWVPAHDPRRLPEWLASEVDAPPGPASPCAGA